MERQMKTPHIQNDLTPTQVAQELNISEPTAYRWLSDGKIRSYRAGRLRRCTREALDRFKESNSTETAV